MRTVQFTTAEQEGLITYPDDVSLFRKTEISVVNGVRTVTAQYKGDLPLDDGEYEKQYRKKMSKREFMSLFTPAEHKAIKQATKTDEVADQLWDVMLASDDINLTLTQAVEGMNYLVTASVLTQPRHDEIMKGVESTPAP
jgi:hypothetical protein